MKQCLYGMPMLTAERLPCYATMLAPTCLLGSPRFQLGPLLPPLSPPSPWVTDNMKHHARAEAPKSLSQLPPLSLHKSHPTSPKTPASQQGERNLLPPFCHLLPEATRNPSWPPPYTRDPGVHVPSPTDQILFAPPVGVSNNWVYCGTKIPQARLKE